MDRDFREIQFISDHLGGEQVQYSRPLNGQGRQLLTGAYGANFDNFRDSFGATLPTVENASSYAQLQRTAFLRDDATLGPRLSGNVALFFSTYDTLGIRRFDPHGSLSYKPDADSTVTFAVGSGFVPQRLSDLSAIGRRIRDAFTVVAVSGNAAGLPRLRR